MVSSVCLIQGIHQFTGRAEDNDCSGEAARKDSPPPFVWGVKNHWLGLGKDRVDGQTLTILRGIKGPALDIKNGLRADPHGRKERGMQITHANRIFYCEARPLVGRLAIDKPLANAATKKHHCRAASKMPVLTVVIGLLEKIFW